MMMKQMLTAEVIALSKKTRNVMMDRIVKRTQTVNQAGVKMANVLLLKKTVIMMEYLIVKITVLM